MVFRFRNILVISNTWRRTSDTYKFRRPKLRAAAKARSIPTNEFGRVSQRLVDRVFDKHHTDGLFGIKRKKFPENRGPKHHNANRKVRLVLGASYFLFVRVYLCHSLTTSFLEYQINRLTNK